MFNDDLDVRIGNIRRNKQLAKGRGALRQRARASATAHSINRSGGGLGRQRLIASLFGRMGGRARLGGGASHDMLDAIHRFGIVDRQPGVHDPGVASPGRGGGGGIGPVGHPPRFDAGVPDWNPAAAGGGTDWNPETNPAVNDPNSQQNQAVVSSMDTSSAATGATGSLSSGVNIGGQNVPAGYVLYKGQLIPQGLFRGLQQTGELF